jgi:hypothetical protein
MELSVTENITSNNNGYDENAIENQREIPLTQNASVAQVNSNSLATPDRTSHNTISKRKYRKRNIGFSCQKCQKMYSSKQALQRHEKSKHNIESQNKRLPFLTFQCDQCNRKFTRSNFLTNHKKTHFVKMSFECIICNEKFTTKEHLIEHQMSKHNFSEISQSETSSVNA